MVPPYVGLALNASACFMLYLVQKREGLNKFWTFIMFANAFWAGMWFQRMC